MMLKYQVPKELALGIGCKNMIILIFRLTVRPMLRYCPFWLFMLFDRDMDTTGVTWKGTHFIHISKTVNNAIFQCSTYTLPVAVQMLFRP